MLKESITIRSDDPKLLVEIHDWAVENLKVNDEIEWNKKYNPLSSSIVSTVVIHVHNTSIGYYSGIRGELWELHDSNIEFIKQILIDRIEMKHSNNYELY